MDINEWMNLIKVVAEENGFFIDGGEKQFSIDKNKWHSVAFLIKENSTGYIQVHQWESENETDGGIWGRAVYSLRCCTDVIQFCNIVVMSSGMKAKRVE